MDDPKYFIFSLFLFVTTNIISFYQINPIYFSKWAGEHGALFALLLSIPVSLGFYYAWQFGVIGLGSLWGCRTLAFSASISTFAILTSLYANESFFRPKILISLALASVIVIIQVMWKDK